MSKKWSAFADGDLSAAITAVGLQGGENVKFAAARVSTRESVTSGAPKGSSMKLATPPLNSMVHVYDVTTPGNAGYSFVEMPDMPDDGNGTDSPDLGRRIAIRVAVAGDGADRLGVLANSDDNWNGGSVFFDAPWGTIRLADAQLPAPDGLTFHCAVVGGVGAMITAYWNGLVWILDGGMMNGTDGNADNNVAIDGLDLPAMGFTSLIGQLNCGAFDPATFKWKSKNGTIFNFDQATAQPPPNGNFDNLPDATTVPRGTRFSWETGRQTGNAQLNAFAGQVIYLKNGLHTVPGGKLTALGNVGERVTLFSANEGGTSGPGWVLEEVRGNWQLDDPAAGAGALQVHGYKDIVAYGDGMSAAFTMPVPVYGLIDKIYFMENGGHPVTGLKIGTTLGGNDVVAAHNIGANEANAMPDSEILKWWPYGLGAGTLYVDAAAWAGGVNLDFWVRYRV